MKDQKSELFKIIEKAFAEASETSVKTKPDVGVTPDLDLSGKLKHPMEPQVEPASDKTGDSTTSQQWEPRRAGAGRTAQALSGVDMDRDTMRRMMDMMSDFEHNKDEIDISNEPDIDTSLIKYDDVEEIRRLPPTMSNLPKVIDSGIMAEYDIDPEWHSVTSLPGYMSKHIRALARQIFGQFTTTSIEDMSLLIDLQGQGPNEHIEMNAVSAYVKKHGTRRTDAEIKFQKVFQGYDIDLEIFDTDGYTFMLAKDIGGRYIYVWPSSDNTS